jgi:hypothetical protein
MAREEIDELEVAAREIVRSLVDDAGRTRQRHRATAFERTAGIGEAEESAFRV